MSFVSVVRDYIDWINADFDQFHRSFGIPMTFWAFAKGNLTFLCHLIKTGCLYLLTFQWLRDLVYLPVLIPKITVDSVRETFVGLSISAKSPSLAGFSFLGTSSLVQNKILVGFFNSFFACLPLTFVHFIALRHLYVKGFEAALAINGGMIFGHLFFLSSVLFGWRGLLIPWLECESWMYFLQIGLLLFYVRQSLLPTRYVVAPLKKPGQILRTVLFGFILTIGDHGLCFRYMNSLTGGLEPTFVEPLSSTIQGTGSLTQHHFVYIFSFFLGSLLFTSAFFWIALTIRSWVAVRLRLVEEGSTGLAWDVNTWSAPFCLIFFWVCLPFYSADYLTSRPFGYMPYDQALRSGTGATNTLEDKYINLMGFVPKTFDEIKKKEKPSALKQAFARRFIDIPKVGEAIADSVGLGRFSPPSLEIKSRKLSFAPSSLLVPKSFFPIYPKMDRDLAHSNEAVLYRPSIIRRDYHPPWTNEMYRILKSDLCITKDSHRIDPPKRFMVKTLVKKVVRMSQKLTVKRGPVRSIYRGARSVLKPLFPEPVKKKRKKRRRSTGPKLRTNLFRLWSAATLGQGGNFGQFRVYNDFVTVFDPYDTSTFTLQDAEIGDEIDSLTQTLLKSKRRVSPATLAAAQRINELFLSSSFPAASAVFPRHENDAKQNDAKEEEEDEEEGDKPEYIDEDQELLDTNTSPIPVHSRTALLTALTSSIFFHQKITGDQTPRTFALWPRLFSYQTQPSRSELWVDYYDRRYYQRLRLNQLTSFLFRTDIDRFLARQPKGQLLTAKEEQELYFKRLMVKNFVQTNAKYRRAFWRDPSLREVFHGTKTMAHRVYNHQFMGTYRSIRNLMRVDFNLADPVNRSARIMKYDMPLFTGDKSRLTSLHEEILFNPNLAKRRARVMISPRARIYRRHLKPGNTRPFYAGWDEDRRAFVLTNRFLPTRVASRTMLLNEDYPQFASLRSLGVVPKRNRMGAPWTKRIFFTTWPVSSTLSTDFLRYHIGWPARALMGRRPSTYQTAIPAFEDFLQLLRESRLNNAAIAKSMTNKSFIEHFNPDFEWRPTQLLFEEMKKPPISPMSPQLHEKLARRRASERFAIQPPLNQDPPETEFLGSNQWPHGFYLEKITKYVKNSWWFQLRPPTPFADRGGYVWPGQQLLKVRGRDYLPKSPIFYLTNFGRKLSRSTTSLFSRSSTKSTTKSTTKSKKSEKSAKKSKKSEEEEEYPNLPFKPTRMASLQKKLGWPDPKAMLAYDIFFDAYDLRELMQKIATEEDKFTIEDLYRMQELLENFKKFKQMTPNANDSP